MPYTQNWIAETHTRAEIEALEGTTLLEFGAEWCPHCQQIQAALELALPREVRHLKFEDGKGRRLGRSFGVKLWPNFVLIHQGQILVQLARPNAQQLQSALDQLTQ